MKHSTTPYEAALRLQTGYGRTHPKEGAEGGSPFRRRTIRPNGTPDWQLFIVLEGCYVINPESRNETHLYPGSAVLYPPHMTQDQMLHHDHDEGRTFWAHFFPEISMMPFLEWPQLPTGEGFLKWEHDESLNEKILGACERSVSYFESDYIRSRSLSLLALEETLRLLHQVHPSSQLDHMDDRVAIILQYIANNIHLPLSAKDLAGLIGLSPSRLSHLFSVSMHCGIMEYVEKQRVSKACRMLSNSELPVALIAEKCGFSSPYYFSKRFRLHHSMSPSEYRKLAIEQG